jgi:hypothetical protein
MKTKTSDLTLLALDWVVAKIEGHDVYIPAFASQPWLQIRGEHGFVYRCPKYTTDWVQGGPIIEREGINIIQSGSWLAEMDADHSGAVISAEGPTPLIAAMRCYVASKLGDEVEIPEELL